MPTSVAALQIFLILLPGFAAAYLVQTLTVRAKQSDLEKIIESLLFSIAIYVSYSVSHDGQQTLVFLHPGAADYVEFHPGSITWLFVITLLWAGAMILFVNRDGTRFLRKIKLTERTSRGSIWHDPTQRRSVQFI